jgi:hypothetical protein
VTERLLTWREAADELGWGSTSAAGRKLRHAVRAREAQLGRAIATTIGRGPKPQQRITLAALVRDMPELRPAPIPKAALRTVVEGLDERIAETIERQVGPQIRELFSRDLVLEQQIDTLRKEQR